MLEPGASSARFAGRLLSARDRKSGGRFPAVEAGLGAMVCFLSMMEMKVKRSAAFMRALLGIAGLVINQSIE